MPRSMSLQPLPQKGETDTGATCAICGAYLRRNTDLPRHMLTHSKDKQSLMFTCPMDGCGHQTLQKSNLATHIRTHTRAKPHKCPEYFSNGQKCDFSTADPSSLHRHRKRKHGYTPRPKPPDPVRSYSRYLSRRGSDVDAEGDPASECESEESFGLRPEGSRSRRRAEAEADAEGEAERDEELDAEGEPDPELEMMMDLPHIENVSAERTEPPPDPPVLDFPGPPLDPPPPMLQLALVLDGPVLPLANISDTRTDVDNTRHALDAQ
ncbi:hypothetical protein C8R44DRAFT_188486 [Mycena epipterygia]|nr:hypothetical protein C8R44DRAFT_188486 [Mycena epipterygia]